MFLREMDEKTLKEEEYEAQYYEEFTSTSFLLYLKDIVEENASSIFDFLEKQALRSNSLKSSTKLESSRNIMQARVFFTKYLKIHLDNIQPVVKDFLSIPENIIFESDKVNEGFVDNIEALESECAELEHKITQQKIYSALLMEEATTLKQLMPLVDKMNKLIHDPANQELNDISLVDTRSENQENQTQKPLWKLLKKKRNAWKYNSLEENK